MTNKPALVTRVENLETNLERLTQRLDDFIAQSTREDKSTYASIYSCIEKQREEIIKLREELSREREDRQNRRVNAIRRLKSE